MIDEIKRSGGRASLRRMRKTLLRDARQSQAFETHSIDLPVFLAQRQPAAWLEDESYAEPDYQTRLSRTLSDPFDDGEFAESSPDENLNVYQRYRRNLSAFWRQEDFTQYATRFALVAVLLPLAVFATFGRTHQPQVPVISNAEVKLPPPPAFDLEKRLAFGRPLGERLLSHAIEQSLEQPAHAVADMHVAETQKSDEPQHIEDPTPAIALDENSFALSGLAPYDQDWSLPFDSKPYAPAALPRTAEASFRTELAMTDLMKERSERNVVAENKEQAVAPVPTAKPNKIVRRRKAVAHKKRTSPANQMTATATQPPVTPKEPNLPPPPILFFLGAPPPPPAQPGQ